MSSTPKKSCVRACFRTCLCCRKRAEKKVLLRFVARIDETQADTKSDNSCQQNWYVLERDEKQTKSGRGVYLFVEHLKEKKVRHPKIWENALKLPKGSLKASQISELLGESTSSAPYRLEQKNKVRVVHYGTNKNL